MDLRYPDGELAGRLRAMARSIAIALMACERDDRNLFIEQCQNLKVQVEKFWPLLPEGWFPHGA